MSYRTLDPLDSAFVTLEVPSAPLHIGVILEIEVDGDLDPRERFDVMKANIAARIHEIPVLTQRVLRTPFDLAWPVFAEDPDFDIDTHVVRRSVPTPGQTHVPEVQTPAPSRAGFDPSRRSVFDNKDPPCRDRSPPPPRACEMRFVPRVCR